MGEPKTSTAKETDVPEEECRAQLQRILNSADFEASHRERQFLTYVVEETLSKRADRIKAYSIAVEVFGRETSFDPQTDPIVRIKAGHLRRSLERYYLTGGRADPITIVIPKGAYVPSFVARLQPPAEEPNIPVASTSAANSATPKRIPISTAISLLIAAMALAYGLWWWALPQAQVSTPSIPRVLVENFEDLTNTKASAAVATGMAQEVAVQLSKFKDIVVLQSVETTPGKETVPPRFVLSGTLDLETNVFRLHVILRNRTDGSIEWANSYDGQTRVSGFMDAQADIARNVATTLGQAYGVIPQADASLKVANPPDDWAAYACTLSYYAYRVSLDPTALSEVRSCLERAVALFPKYATAWALLAHVLIDEIRFSFPADPASSKAASDALAIAQHAVELDPRNVRALHAEMSALYVNKQFEAGRRVGAKALTINPNDTDLMGGFGTRMALSGDWIDGCRLVEQARDRNPGPLAYYESVLALCSYFAGDYQQAAMWIRKTAVPRNPLYHLIAAGIFAEGGFGAEADREREWLEENAPALVENLRWEVASRLARSEDAKLFVNSLTKAGLALED